MPLVGGTGSLRVSVLVVVLLLVLAAVGVVHVRGRVPRLTGGGQVDELANRDHEVQAERRGGRFGRQGGHNVHPLPRMAMCIVTSH